MKNLLLLFAVVALVLCGSVPLFAQIPNAGFETWNGSLLSGWILSNVPGTPGITAGTPAHTGNYALKGAVVSIPGYPIALPVTALTQPFFPWNVRSASLTGWYQFFPASGSTDSVIITTLLSRGTSTNGIAAGAVKLGSTGSTYKQFTVPIYWGASGTPDSASISISIAASQGSVTIGSYFLIDDLAFAGVATATAVNDQISSTPQAFELQQNYPNPFNPSTRIDFSVAQPGFIELKVYNVLGSEVATLVNEHMSAGRYGVNWNAAGLSSGVYLYRMTVSSEQGMLFGNVKRLVLLK